MTRRLRVVRACAWTAIVAALLVTTAPVAADDASVIGDAEREFRAGYRALEAGDCHTALVHYQRSYELAARPRTLFNMGVCQEELGQGSAAWSSYLAFLRIAEPRDAAIVTRARERIDALRARLRGRAFIDTVPSGAIVYLNDEQAPRGTTPLALSIEPGVHRLRIVPGEGGAVQRTLEIVPDGVATVSIELARPAVVVPAPVEPIAPPPVAPPARVRIGTAPGAAVTLDGAPLTLHMREVPSGMHELRVEQPGHRDHRAAVTLGAGEDVTITVELPRRRSRALVWGLTGAGTGALAAGGVLGVLALRDVTSPIADHHDRGKVRALVADGMIVTGAIALFVAWRASRPTAPTIGLERRARDR